MSNYKTAIAGRESKPQQPEMRDLSEISRGGGGGGNFKFGFGNEVTHPCNESEIC